MEIARAEQRPDIGFDFGHHDFWIITEIVPGRKAFARLKIDMNLIPDLIEGLLLGIGKIVGVDVRNRLDFHV